MDEPVNGRVRIAATRLIMTAGEGTLIERLRKLRTLIGGRNISVAELQGLLLNGSENDLVEENVDDFHWLYVPGLHVHHKKYIVGKLPWEYVHEDLTTLCWLCHEKLHKEQVVPVFDQQGNKLDDYTPRERCHGAGIFPEYGHVEQGICFQCHGARYNELING